MRTPDESTPLAPARPLANHPAPPREADRQYVVALARGLQLLRAFRGMNCVLRHQDIVSRTGLPKASVSRFLHTLMALGYVEQARESGQYRLGASALAWALDTAQGSLVQHIARPLMESMARHHDLCATLGLRDGIEVVYAEYFRGPSVVTMALERGARIPLMASALGRSLLISATAQERQEISRQVIEAAGLAAPQLEDAYKRFHRDWSRYGFTVSIGEWNAEVNSIATPLVAHGGQTRFALAFGGPAHRMSETYLLEKVGPLLLATAEEINEKIAQADGH